MYYILKIGFKGTDILDKALLVVRALFLSWMIAAILLIPFNYYLRYTTNNAITETLKLPILSVSDYSENRCFFCQYEGKSTVYYAYKPIMADIYKNNNASDYHVVFTVKKGNFGVFKILDWDIKAKR